MSTASAMPARGCMVRRPWTTTRQGDGAGEYRDIHPRAELLKKRIRLRWMSLRFPTHRPNGRIAAYGMAESLTVEEQPVPWADSLFGLNTQDNPRGQRRRGQGFGKERGPILGSPGGLEEPLRGYCRVHFGFGLPEFQVRALRGLGCRVPAGMSTDRGVSSSVADAAPEGTPASERRRPVTMGPAAY